MIKKKQNYCSKHKPVYENWKSRTYAEEILNKKYQIHAGIRGLARIVYQKSDKPKYCYNCGYSKHIEVCHIKPIKSFENHNLLGEINHINNLIALCKNCHKEFDCGLLNIPDRI